VAILRSREPSGEPPLVWFGPTGGGLQNFVGRAIKERLDPDRVFPPSWKRDLVVYDWRGTGLSEPALCPDFGATPRSVEAGDASPASRNRFRSEVGRCVAALRGQGIDRAAYNATACAADLADLRRVLGYASWDVYAGAYGARVALEALRTHPEGIRSVVLEDPWPPGPTLAERPLWTQRALERAFAGCRSDPACRAAFPTPEDDFYALHDELEHTPLPVPPAAGSGGPAAVLNAEGLVATLERYLHFARTFAQIPLLLHELRRGDRLRAARELIRQGRPETRVAWYLVNCFDQYGPTFESRSNSVMAMVAPSFRVRTLENCDLWQDRFADPSEHADVRSSIPTLILTGELSVEPPLFGRRIAATLSRAYFYEFPGEPHGLRPEGCRAAILFGFLADPARAPDASCIASMRPFVFATRWPP
jgi:pimeloyl-ACP methyl ester carboxylesterase